MPALNQIFGGMSRRRLVVDFDVRNEFMLADCRNQHDRNIHRRHALDIFVFHEFACDNHAADALFRENIQVIQRIFAVVACVTDNRAVISLSGRIHHAIQQRSHETAGQARKQNSERGTRLFHETSGNCVRRIAKLIHHIQHCLFRLFRITGLAVQNSGNSGD